MVAAAMPGEAAGAPVPLSTSRRRAPRWVTWASHAAAILLGVLLARSWGGSLFSGDSDAWRMVSVDSGEPALREVRVEVPVETIVERLVEVKVPVEVAVEVPVEVMVEVPVEVERIIYRDRPVPHPLQARWDTQLAVANTMGKAGLLALQGLDRTLSRMANHASGPELDFPVEPAVIAAAEPRKRGRARIAAAESSQAHVEVRRRSGRVTLVTRGALADVVPVLIDTLEAGDDDVRTAAFDRPQSIRADFGEEGLALSAPSKDRARPGGIRGLLYHKNERAPAPAPEDPALWRDWWNRQKAASGVTSITTSI